jgi:lysozyme
MTETAEQYAIKILMDEEGFSATPYRCTAGKLTIGYGTNLDDGILSKKRVDEILNAGPLSKECAKELLDYTVGYLHTKLEHRLPFFRDEPYKIQAVLICMAYQMGPDGLYGFENMIVAFKEGDYKTVCPEMLDSKWAKKDTPERANRMEAIVRKAANDKFFEECGPYDRPIC